MKRSIIIAATVVMLLVLILTALIFPTAYRLYHYRSVRHAIEAKDPLLARRMIDRLPSSYDLNWTLWDDIEDIPQMATVYGYIVGCPSCAAEGYPLLWHAARAGDTESMKVLIEKGASIRFRNDSGSEILRAAAISENTNAIAILLSNGAEIVDTNYVGIAPIHMTVLSPSGNKTLKYIIDAGADVNVPDWQGRTPLDYAYTWNTNAIPLLLDRGAALGTSDWLKVQGIDTAQQSVPGYAAQGASSPEP